MLITRNYNNMGDAKKTVIHIPKHRVGQYLLIRYPLLFKNFSDLQ